MAEVPYLTAAQVRVRQPRITDVSDGEIERLVAEFEALAERYRGVGFTTREATHVGRPRRGVLELPHVQILSIVSVEDSDSNAITFDTDYLDAARGCMFVDRNGWVTVEYTHGMATTPEGILAACAAYVMRRVVNSQSGTSRDVLSQNFDGGTTRYSTPDWAAGRPTGYLDIDAALNAERDFRYGG